MAELSMVPLGEGEGDSVGAFVAQILDVIDRSGVGYRLTPMGTIIEGSADEVFPVLRACRDRGRELAPRISMSIKIDDRDGEASRLASKLESVEHRLGRNLRKLS